jgi:hypothetical protein
MKAKKLQNILFAGAMLLSFDNSETIMQKPQEGDAYHGFHDGMCGIIRRYLIDNEPIGGPISHDLFMESLRKCNKTEKPGIKIPEKVYSCFERPYTEGIILCS